MLSIFGDFNNIRRFHGVRAGNKRRAIEVITAQTKVLKVRDEESGELKELKVNLWNPTIANLTLMALGSSAPEILLSCIETVSNLGSEPGELGPSTIVGSAAFNLLVISGVSVAAVTTGTMKKVFDVGVFAVTASFSLFAYAWMYVVLTFSSEDVISMWEAVVTFLFFPVLIGFAFAVDKIATNRRKKKVATGEMGKEKELTPEDFYHILAIHKENIEKGKQDDDNQPKASPTVI